TCRQRRACSSSRAREGAGGAPAARACALGSTSKKRRPGRRLMLLIAALPSASHGPEQVEHGPVELVAAEGGGGDVGAPAVEHPEVAAQVPQGPAPPRLLPQRQAVAHPGQDDLVRRELVGAPLADVNADAGALELLPRLDALPAQLGPVPGPPPL